MTTATGNALSFQQGFRAGAGMVTRAVAAGITHSELQIYVEQLRLWHPAMPPPEPWSVLRTARLREKFLRDLHAASKAVTA